MKSLVLNNKRLPDGKVLETKMTFNQNNELMIYDYISPNKHWEGDTSVTPSDVLDFLRNAPSDLVVRINSQGGEVGASLAIYNRLLEFGSVTTVVDGYAFSCAGWIALAGNKREICNGGLFMMHDPYFFAVIDGEDSIANAKNMWNAHRDAIVDIFTARTPLKAENVKDMMHAETYLSASESVGKGLFHNVRNARPDTAILNSLRIPKEALNKAEIPAIDTVELRTRTLNLRKKMLGK